jgi:hypothetical protein
VIYSGQKVPHGNINTDELKAKMIKLGTGYDLWARVVDKTLSTNKLDNFLLVTDKAKKDPLLICKLFLPSWDPLTSMQLALNNKPCGTITNVQSDNYPQAAQTIKRFFLPNPPAHAFTPTMAMPGILTFQLPGDLKKESKAKKEITKLMLLHICAEINFKESSIYSMTFVTPSNNTDDLIYHTLLTTKEQDHLSI